jgi:hypothetical protein
MSLFTTSITTHPPNQKTRQAALAAETEAFTARAADISAKARAWGAKYASTRVAPSFYTARLGLAVEHGPGSRAQPGEVLCVFTLLDPADPAREGLLGIRMTATPKTGGPGAGGSGRGGAASSASSGSAKAIAVTRCEPPLPAVLPGLCARLADPGDAFGMRQLVIGVRKAFVEAFGRK